MNELRKHILIILSVVFFISAIIQEHHVLNEHPEAKLIGGFQKTMLAQQSHLAKCLSVAERKLSDSLSTGSFVSRFSYLNPLYQENGLGFVIFNDSKMVYWSSNQFAFPNIQNKFSAENRLLILPNGIYTAEKRHVGHFVLIGLIHIKNNYSYENQFLKNTFVPPFDLPSEFNVVASPDKKGFAIYDLSHSYLLSVVPSGANLLSESQLYIPAILYLLAFIFLLLAFFRFTRKYQSEHFVAKMLAVFLILSVIYGLHIVLGFPNILNHLSIFTAQYYAQSNWLPSLGDFFLITGLFFFWALVFVREYPSAKNITRPAIFPSFLFVGFLYELIGSMIVNMVSNSSIPYKLNRITDINLFSFTSYLVIAILLFSVFIIHLKVIENTEHLIRKKVFFRLHLVALPAAIILCLIYPFNGFFVLAIFLAVSLLQSQIKKMQISRFSLSYSILFISLFSVITLLLVYSTVKKRDLQIQKLMAINLSSEQDPVAEVFLTRMQRQFNTDSMIPKLLVPPYKGLESYLTRTYFSGYFRKYDIQFTFCSNTDSLLLQP